MKKVEFMKLALMIATKSILGKLKSFKEHLAHLRYGRTEKSSISEHVLEVNHTITLDNLRLIKNVSDRRLLNAYESMEIVKWKYSLNNVAVGTPSRSR